MTDIVLEREELPVAMIERESFLDGCLTLPEMGLLAWFACGPDWDGDVSVLHARWEPFDVSAAIAKLVAGGYLRRHEVGE